MNAIQIVLLSIVSLAAVYVLLRIVVALDEYLKVRGKMLVTCPETKKAAAVEVAAGRAATQALVGTPHLRLRECSRWPERRNCGQQCLSQIEAAPEECLVWNIVGRWYEDKTCVYCHKPFGHLEWHDHRPALMNADHKTVQWHQVAVEKLPEVLTTHWPVCWKCHVAETFRREHPELVVDRPRH
jgi:hypothetical protein